MTEKKPESPTGRFIEGVLETPDLPSVKEYWEAKTGRELDSHEIDALQDEEATRLTQEFFRKELEESRKRPPSPPPEKKVKSAAEVRSGDPAKRGQ